MSRSTEPVDDAPDARGRVEVWSAGTRASSARGRVHHPLRRGLGLFLVAAAAVCALAYAVHAWVITPPAPVGVSVPLWLPDQLPADRARGTGDTSPSPHPTAVPSRSPAR